MTLPEPALCENETMEKTTCLEVLKQGPYAWNTYLLDEGLQSACLSEANLGGADLRRVNLA